MNEADGNLVAILGPTNTGKTYLAFDRMMAYKSGIFGFPLRLLARENYDKAVIAESFERIHRSNLIGMGVLPLQFIGGENKQTLKLDGSEIVSIKGLDNISPNSEIDCEIQSDQKINIKLLCRIDTIKELDYYKQGGILQYVLNSIIKKAS